MSFVAKIKKYDTVWIGIFTAIILIIVGFLLSYLVKGYSTGIAFSRYVKFVTNDSPDRMDILIFSMIPNMLLFYFTNFRWQFYEFVKGLVVVSVLFALLIVLLSV